MMEQLGIFSPKRRLFKEISFDDYDEAMAFCLNAQLAYPKGMGADFEIKLRRGVSIKPIKETQ